MCCSYSAICKLIRKTEEQTTRVTAQKYRVVKQTVRGRVKGKGILPQEYRLYWAKRGSFSATDRVFVLGQAREI
jgi:hypothetical protein